MKTISLRLPDTLAEALAAAAHRKQVSSSEYVRDALELKLESERQVPSMAELTADLIGSCEGPADLSTNKAYFDDFGK